MNKKGFTLIELLAVIVILAIIALIATPIVMNVIDNAQDGANKRSVEAYAKALEAEYYEQWMLTGEEPDIKTLTPDYNGAKVTDCTPEVVPGTKQIKLANCKVAGEGSYTYENGKVA